MAKTKLSSTAPQFFSSFMQKISTGGLAIGAATFSMTALTITTYPLSTLCIVEDRVVFCVTLYVECSNLTIMLSVVKLNVVFLSVSAPGD